MPPSGLVRIITNPCKQTPLSTTNNSTTRRATTFDEPQEQKPNKNFVIILKPETSSQTSPEKARTHETWRFSCHLFVLFLSYITPSPLHRRISTETKLSPSLSLYPSISPSLRRINLAAADHRQNFRSSSSRTPQTSATPSHRSTAPLSDNDSRGMRRVVS